VELQSFLEKEGAYELFDATETSEVKSPNRVTSFLEKEGAYELFHATETSEVMSRFDTNGNGYLDLAEIVMSRFDTNGNGYLDLLEMQALREVLRERKKEYQGEIGKAKAAESKASERIMKRGAGIGDLQSEIHSLNSKVVEITPPAPHHEWNDGNMQLPGKTSDSKQVERNTEMEQKMMSLIVNIGSKMEQKMMSLIVNIGSKVDTLVNRDKALDLAMVDTLVNRDKDFKFLKEGIGQDWLK
ncbi:hypothetical protein T484DRAFT_1832930, partial [Baffinella frigidus]